MNKNLKRIIGFIIAFTYLSSLTMECYLVNGEASIGSFGVIAFLLGWLNFNLIGLIWLANPLFIISLRLFFCAKKQNLALALTGIALILALSFMQIQEIIKTEAGHKGEIDGYQPGYWLWLTSISLLLITFLTNNMMKKKTINKNN